MDKYFDKKNKHSLEELFEELLSSPYGRLPETFIASWMLSMLVRYKPVLWQNLLSGKYDKMSINLQKFHEVKVPEAFNSLFKKYGAVDLNSQY